MQRLHQNRIARTGMTLIELIVVMTLLGILATLVVVYVIPAFQDNKNVIRATDRVTTALLMAKQRALRDQAPRGVRFYLDPNAVLPPQLSVGSQIFPQLQFIELPDVLTGQLASSSVGALQLTGLPISPVTPPTLQVLNFSANVDFFGGADANNSDEAVVQPGDYFCYGGSNYRILSVPTKNSLKLANPLAVTISSNPEAYQIIRGTRPISGETLINLPQNVYVDIGTIGSTSSANQVPTRPNTTTQTIFEIVFDASGSVMNRGGSAAIAILVRDVTADIPATSSGFLFDPNSARVLGINPRTGMISAQPVAPGTNPAAFVLDGLSSGL